MANSRARRDNLTQDGVREEEARYLAVEGAKADYRLNKILLESKLRGMSWVEILDQMRLAQSDGTEAH
jgi:hypothetical protein